MDDDLDCFVADEEGTADEEVAAERGVRKERLIDFGALLGFGVLVRAGFESLTTLFVAFVLMIDRGDDGDERAVLGVCDFCPLIFFTDAAFCEALGRGVTSTLELGFGGVWFALDATGGRAL